ncbi:hypothetical protein NBRC116494_08080 [Aurantivibrio plasticivorans]
MNKRLSGGFTLWEVLVTLIITSIGFLGLGALQLVSMKNVNNSNYRTLATMYAHDMAERIRANRSAQAIYNGISAPADRPICNSCSPTQIAQIDAFEWETLITQGDSDDLANGSLPNGEWSISRVGASSFFEITITWDEQISSNDGGSVGEQNYILRVQI